MFRSRRQLRGVKAAPRRLRRGWRTASIFIIAMWVLLILSSFVLSFARSMRVEAIAASNRLGQVKASEIELGAEQYVLGQVYGTLGDAASLCGVPAQAIPIGDGYFWLIRPNPVDDTAYDFGLIDECSKLNLNTASDAMLANLPNITQDVADSIVTWRSVSGQATGQGADNSFYNGLQPEAYNLKSAPFETVDELMLLKGPNDTTMGDPVTGNMNSQVQDPRMMPLSMLYGLDLNRDGVVDDQERTVANSNGQSATFGSGLYSDTRGLAPFVTVFSVDPNSPTDSSGNPRINVNVVSQSNRKNLISLLSTVVASSRAQSIVATVMAANRAHSPFKSIFAWYQASGLQPSEFGPIAGSLTVKSGPIKGLININTAPQQVLLCLPGLQQTDVQNIVNNRPATNGGVTTSGGSSIAMGSSSNATPPNTDLTWLFQNLSPQAVAAIGPYVTTESYQYSADIVAVSHDGDSFKRVRIVVDATNSPPVILYRKDLTSLGWPLPEQIRDALRNGQPPPTIAAGRTQ